MDLCSEIDDETGIDVFDIRDVPSLVDYEETLNDEIDIFSMTSLGTLVFLSQRDNNDVHDNSSVEEHRLSLAYEKLTTFPKSLLDSFSTNVQILDISHNQFSNLDFLIEFKQLTHLICDHNNLTSAVSLPDLPKLQLLWMNFCKITDLYPWARHLKMSCPNIKYLSLMGNDAAPSYLNGGSFYDYLQYRLFVISLFPDLEHLDDRRVSEEQRQEALRLYRRPLLERIGSKSTLILPAKLRTVSNKISDLLAPSSPFPAPSNRNIII